MALDEGYLAVQAFVVRKPLKAAAVRLSAIGNIGVLGGAALAAVKAGSGPEACWPALLSLRVKPEWRAPG